MTLFNTPLLTPFIRLIALCIAKVFGWKVPDNNPGIGKAVLIGAPHTSNWDFIWMLTGAIIMRLEVNWIGKHTLFVFPFGPLMRYLGGTAINRGASKNFVEAVVDQFNQSEKMMVVIAPEGTRSPVKKWKSGFYFMAHLSNVPIVMCYVDYKDKVIGIKEVLTTSGDAEKDIAHIQEAYATVAGKIPHNYYGYKGSHKNL